MEEKKKEELLNIQWSSALFIFNTKKIRQKHAH